MFFRIRFLESSDYHSRENATSYVCAEPVAGITSPRWEIRTRTFPDGTKEIKIDFVLADEIAAFKARFEVR
jgi:anthranilate synthase component 1